jgi:hypothetical protein
VAWAAPVAVAVLAYHWAYFGIPLRQGPRSALSPPPGDEGHLAASSSRGQGASSSFTADRRDRGDRSSRARCATTIRALAATCGAAACSRHWLFVGRWAAVARWRVLGTAAHDGRAASPLPVPARRLRFGPQAHPRARRALRGRPGPGRVHVRTTVGSACASGPSPPSTRSCGTLPRSPIAYYAGRRLAIFALPGVEEGKAVIRSTHPVVVGRRAHGIRVTFAGDRLRAFEGTDETMQGRPRGRRGPRPGRAPAPARPVGRPFPARHGRGAQSQPPTARGRRGHGHALRGGAELLEPDRPLDGVPDERPLPGAPSVARSANQGGRGGGDHPRDHARPARRHGGHRVAGRVLGSRRAAIPTAQGHSALSEGTSPP